MKKRLAFKVYYDDETGEISEIKSSKAMELEGKLLQIHILQETSKVFKIVHDYEAREHKNINKIARA